MARTADECKQLSIREFTKAAKVYESGHAGIYEMCKDDYPQMLAELEREPFADVLDAGCGTGAVIELLHEKYPDAHYVGLDLTPDMIAVAQAKSLNGCEFVVGDAEDLPFPANSFEPSCLRTASTTIPTRRNSSPASRACCAPAAASSYATTRQTISPYGL